MNVLSAFGALFLLVAFVGGGLWVHQWNNGPRNEQHLPKKDRSKPNFAFLFACIVLGLGGVICLALGVTA